MVPLVTFDRNECLYYSITEDKQYPFKEIHMRFHFVYIDIQTENNKK